MFKLRLSYLIVFAFALLSIGCKNSEPKEKSQEEIIKEEETGYEDVLVKINTNGATESTYPSVYATPFMDTKCIADKFVSISDPATIPQCNSLPAKKKESAVSYSSSRT